MSEFTFAGQKYYFTEEQVNFYRKRLILGIYEQNYFTEKEYSNFTFEYGEDVYTISKFDRLTYDIVSNMLENVKDGLEEFYNENVKDGLEEFYNEKVKIEEDERKITFVDEKFILHFPIDDKVKKAFKEQIIAYFGKRFFPETEEDFEFLSKFILSVVFYNLYVRLRNAKQQENKEFIQNEVIFYIKKLNILERFGVDEFKFAQLELDLQIKFLALMSIYKKSEPINSIINFFDSDLLTKGELNNFIKNILDSFCEEHIDETSKIKNFVLKSKVLGQIGINQTTNEVMFEIIKDKLLNLNDADKNQFIDKLEKFANDDKNLYVLGESLGDSVKFNTTEFEIFFKYSHSEMIKKFICAYNFDSNFVEKDMTLVKFNEKIYENENLKNKILKLQEQTKIIITFQNIVNSHQWNSINSLEQMLWEKEMEILDYVYNNVKPEDRKIYIYLIDKAKIILDKKIDIELITENLIKILLKDTESVENLQQKEQIILPNAQKIFDDIHNDKVEPGRREIYRKALAKAIDLAKGKIYTEDFINIFRKCICEKWWQFKKTPLQKKQIIFIKAQEIFDYIYSDKIIPEKREIYKKSLDTAMNIVYKEIDYEYKDNLTKTYEKQFAKCIKPHWYSPEKSINEQRLVISELFTKLAVGLTGIALITLNLVYKNLMINLQKLEKKSLKQKIDKFKMNSEQTSEEIFDLSEKLWNDINSSSQPENVKNSLLKKVNDIGQEKFENIPPQQINSDFKFFPNR